MESKKEYIRNFSIIAHIDHGKSTLADRLIEMTGVLSKREMEAQVLDNMDIERERGITIKSQAVRMRYLAKDGKQYVLNLIDTPGHVDFNYEVSRSLAACDGAILVVDSSQGVEAQTLANVYLAIDNNLEILPVLNKVDLPNARPEEVKKEIEDIIGIPAEDSPCISAKSGLNVEEVLERIVLDLPAPTGDEKAPLSCLIFDSLYNDYKGAIAYVRIKDGTVKVGDEILLMSTNKAFTVAEVGHFEPGRYEPCEMLEAGEVGYIAAEVPDAIKKAIQEAKKNLIEVPIVGTTIPHEYIGKFGSANVMLKPAAEGTGIIAGGSVRPVIELAGYRDIRTKVLGTNNPRNVVYATIEGLKKMQTLEQVAKKRGKKVEEIL